MRHGHNCGCSMCFDVNYPTTSREDLEAAAAIYDNVVWGCHERVQAEALEWIRWFNGLSQADMLLAARDQLTPDTQKLRDTPPISTRIQ